MNDLDRIKRLAGILTEGVMAVPALGNKESNMQSNGNAERGNDDAEFDAAQPQVDESAPPGMEDMVMKLKKQYPGEEEKAFATAWAIYNKKHGNNESMMEDGALDDIIQQSASRLEDMLDSYVDYEQAVNVLMQELHSAGHSEENIEEILNGVNDLLSGETDGGMAGPDDMSADADALASAGFGSDEDYSSAEDMMEVQDTDDSVCPSCSGSGEGRFGGNCKSCGGSGTHQTGEPDDGYTDPLDDWDGVSESFDLNNGYDDIEFMSPGDFFPDGADGPVTSSTGPSGARHGDNPEQKKMQVAETHKELVYNYRKFLKESVKK